jgi:hypothetical protein
LLLLFVQLTFLPFQNYLTELHRLLLCMDSLLVVTLFLWATRLFGTSRRLCPYTNKVEEVLQSGLMPNGKACSDAESFKRIWNEAMQTSAVCEPTVGRP